jgi:hypothetical protein
MKILSRPPVKSSTDALSHHLYVEFSAGKIGKYRSHNQQDRPRNLEIDGW